MYGYIDGYDFGEISVRTPRGLVKNGNLYLGRKKFYASFDFSTYI